MIYNINYYMNDAIIRIITRRTQLFELLREGRNYSNYYVNDAIYDLQYKLLHEERTI
jgi:hypothetical protein